MGSQAPHHQLHFVLFPFMAQGHMIPMMDIAKILVQHNVIVTVVTTPKNATRFTPIFARYNESGFQIRLVELQFQFEEAGLQDGCENLDMLYSLSTSLNLFIAANLLRKQVEKLFEELAPPPSCIISDMSLPYTIHIANKFNIPRISFVGMSCFTLLCFSYLDMHNVKERISNESEYFVVPGIPDKIEITIAQTEGLPKDESWKEFCAEMDAADKDSYGMIMNSFEELEPAYARDFKKLKKDKLWCIGPLSLSNNDYLEKAQRGVESPVKWGKEEEIGVLVKKEDVTRAIDELMDETNEGEERRKRVNELAKMATNAVQKGGSSHSDATLFIQDIMQKTKRDMIPHSPKE
ncbi:hypothetical protein RIF29_39881 [Crotalaria pallida]|uniref:Uncharacterized protein n=1 Tax=Crotalaria pallida TaxID=3830 RepID=A0AAN9E3Q0_CROPI